jgi:glycolate oxidase FAD binding subunit
LSAAAPAVERPGSVEEAGALLRSLGQAGRPLRPRGGGTKLGWGTSGGVPEVVIDTRGLNHIVEHNVGDFTAILEAGVTVADAQAAFAAEGQMLALDPPLGSGDAATIGGLVATADSGPLRHRYGGVRDLIVGITVVLSDGTIAKAGGKVIKNVAGYDLSKLFAGSFGTLGLIASVSVRLHPLPGRTATARLTFEDPAELAASAARLAALPLEADCLDVAWAGGRGALLVRFGGATASERAAAVGDAEVLADDGELWAAQRARQRGDVVVKVAGVITDLPAVLRAAESAGGTVVGRAGLGVSWVSLPADGVGGLRDALPGRALTVLDGADRVDAAWPAPDPGALAVMERIKSRFDPARVFRPGAFVGGI